MDDLKPYFYELEANRFLPDFNAEFVALVSPDETGCLPHTSLLILPGGEEDAEYVDIGRFEAAVHGLRSKWDIRKHAVDVTAVQEGVYPTEKEVASFLLGRVYSRPTLKVCLKSAKFLDPLLLGLGPNSIVEELRIYFTVNAGVHRAESSCLLLERTSLRSLHLSNETSTTSLENFLVKVVESNKMQKLDISRAIISGAQSIAHALGENTSIVELVLPDLPAVLETFLQTPSSEVQDLTVRFSTYTRHTREPLARLIASILRTNSKLKKLKLSQPSFGEEQWLNIIESLKSNSTIQKLDLSDAINSLSNPVFCKLHDVLRINCPQITSLGLEGLGDLSPNLWLLNEILPSLSEQLRLNKEYGRALQNAERSTPRSARVIFCGPGYAGKTTLCRTMTKENRNSRSQQILFFLQRRRRLWRLLYGPDADKELGKRTRGVDTYVWRDLKDLRITLWDFAGQKEYYALHDYMFPNVNSANLFLFCFSMVPNPFDPSPNKDVSARLQEIRNELLFWLHFLCSNSKELCNPKPKVRVVLTNSDRAQDSSSREWSQIEDIVHNFAFQFQDRLDVITTVMRLNAHSKPMVTELELCVEEDFRQLIPKLEKTFKVCEDLRKVLGTRKLSTPVITVDKFEEICLKLDANYLRERELREAVASYLHSVGEIIFFKNVNFIVIDPKWLGVAVLGNILDLFGRKSITKFRGIVGCFEGLGKNTSIHKIYLKNGFVEWQGLRRLMRESLQLVTEATGMESDDLINLLLELEICFVDKIRGGYLIPAALDDKEEWAARGLRQLHWTSIQGGRGNPIYFGRRLQCSDQKRTVLTPGFFPRLQVVLQKHLLGHRFIGDHIKPPLEIDRNLLRFWHNAMDIIVEYGDCEHFQGNFIDVMIRTHREYIRAVDFVKEHVLDVIRTFCAQPEGNQGVILVEGIIRPVTVEHLIVCKDRENQAVLISKLEEYVREDVNCQFCWDAVSNAVDPCNRLEPGYAIDALKGPGFHQEIIKRKANEYENMYKVSKTLREPFSKVLSKLLKEQLLPDTPKLIYILGNESGFWRLSNQDVGLRLHLQCECRMEGPHLVKDQAGRSFVVESEMRQTLNRLVDWSYEFCKLIGIVTARSVPFLGALEIGIDRMPARLPVETPAVFDRNSLRIMGKSSPAQIAQFYEEILKDSPCSDWLRRFLDIEGKPDKFEADFRLYKVRYKETQEVAFLCRSCRLQGFTKDFLEIP